MKVSLTRMEIQALQVLLRTLVFDKGQHGYARLLAKFDAAGAD